MNSQHVEIYQSERESLKNVPCDCPDSALIYKNINHKAGGHWDSVVVTEWRWRLRAGNGRILSQSSEAYAHPRDLVRGLELSFPRYRLRQNPRQDHRRVSRLPDGRVRDGWLLVNLDWSAGASPDAFSIPVRVPKGTEDRWKSRRKR